MNIFLSYPSEHETTAWEVYNFLSGKEDDVWFDKISLIAGADWDRDRDIGQRKADLVIHLCSVAILSRTGVINREIRQTLKLADDQPFGAHYVMPIRLERFDLPIELTRFQYFDFGADWKVRLASGVERRRSQLLGSNASPPTLQLTKSVSSQKFELVQFEDVTNSYECRGEYISYPGSGLYWAFVNSTISSAVLSGFFESRSKFKFEIPLNEEKLKRLECRGHEFSVNLEEIFACGELVSIRLYTYMGFAEAAHPNHYIRTLNFLGEGICLAKINDLLDFDVASARKILEFCGSYIISDASGDIDSTDFFKIYEEDDEDVWRLISEFNFNEQGLIFNFSPYAILPFVFGIHSVPVPWSFIQPLLSEEYSKVFGGLLKENLAT